MADDVNDNSSTIQIDIDITLFDLCCKVMDMNFLAKIQGGKAIWLLTVDNVWVGIIAEQWAAPKMLIEATRKLDDVLFKDKNSEIMVYYFAQIDPNMTTNDIEKNCNVWNERRVIQ
jgi:hypothetical protein